MYHRKETGEDAGATIRKNIYLRHKIRFLHVFTHLMKVNDRCIDLAEVTNSIEPIFEGREYGKIFYHYLNNFANNTM